MTLLEILSDGKARLFTFGEQPQKIIAWSKFLGNPVMHTERQRPYLVLNEGEHRMALDTELTVSAECCLVEFLLDVERCVEDAAMKGCAEVRA